MLEIASGFFGKIPSKGDFICRRVAPAFLEVFDPWLQSGILESRAQLQDSWLAIYLGSPVWRFVIGSPVSESTAWAGVLVPSVDRAGRYFPFAVISGEIPTRRVGYFLATMSEWYSQAESLALSVLKEQVDMPEFDREIVANVAPHPLDISIDGGRLLSAGDGDATFYSLPNVEKLPQKYSTIIQCEPNDVLGGASLWWSRGSELVDPVILCCRGLPDPVLYGAMLDGRWIQENRAPVHRPCQ